MSQSTIKPVYKEEEEGIPILDENGEKIIVGFEAKNYKDIVEFNEGDIEYTDLPLTPPTELLEYNDYNLPLTPCTEILDNSDREEQEEEEEEDSYDYKLCPDDCECSKVDFKLSDMNNELSIEVEKLTKLVEETKVKYEDLQSLIGTKQREISILREILNDQDTNNLKAKLRESESRNSRYFEDCWELTDDCYNKNKIIIGLKLKVRNLKHALRREYEKDANPPPPLKKRKLNNKNPFIY